MDSFSSSYTDSPFVTKDSEGGLEDLANLENVGASKRAKVKVALPPAPLASAGRKPSSRRASNHGQA